ncbi:MAG TPA: DUF4097 family beta strand repeat-containing protein [Opitutaceae bacterium]|nr:DUF4097 family beta strand repeat-containing protein [Opitutaceae bacterium]
MKPSLPVLVGLGWLFAAPLILDAKIERTVEKTFTVQPGGTLKVQTSGGNVSVEAGAGDVVKVVAKEKIRADTDAQADELLKDLDLTIEQQGNDVTAIAKYEKKLGSWFGSTPVQVDFSVTVPSRYNTDLKTSGGNITVGDLTGEMLAKTSGGNVKLGNIDGTVDAGTSGGNVSLGSCTGDTKLRTSGGNVRAEKIVGRADLGTSGGDIRVQLVENTLSAHTSGGNVEAAIGGALKGDCSLGTSGGEVRVTVDKAAAFQLDAATSGGSVRADGLTITLDGGGVGKSHLSGKVNGGGPVLKLRTSGGNIRVETR